jgi:hypothetical protein
MHDLPDSHHGERLVELTPVVTVVLVRATTLPTKLVVVPRVADLPVHMAVLAAIDHVHHGGAGGGQGAAHLKDEKRVWVVLGDQRQRPEQ